MGITQGSNKMGYYSENEPNTYQTNSTYVYPQSDPMGTDGQTNKQTDGRMDGQIFTRYSGISSHSFMGVWIKKTSQKDRLSRVYLYVMNSFKLHLYEFIISALCELIYMLIPICEQFCYAYKDPHMQTF
jgi:hypothetical protein